MLATATWVGMSLAYFIVRCNVLTEKCTEQVCRLLYHHRVDTCVTTPSRKQSSASLLSVLPLAATSCALLICTRLILSECSSPQGTDSFCLFFFLTQKSRAI